MDPLQPSATPQEAFVLMLHDRIVQLEEQLCLAQQALQECSAGSRGQEDNAVVAVWGVHHRSGVTLWRSRAEVDAFVHRARTIDPEGWAAGTHKVIPEVGIKNTRPYLDKGTRTDDAFVTLGDPRTYHFNRV